MYWIGLETEVCFWVSFDKIVLNLTFVHPDKIKLEESQARSLKRNNPHHCSNIFHSLQTLKDSISVKSTTSRPQWTTWTGTWTGARADNNVPGQSWREFRINFLELFFESNFIILAIDKTDQIIFVSNSNGLSFWRPWNIQVFSWILYHFEVR